MDGTPPRQYRISLNKKDWEEDSIHSGKKGGKVGHFTRMAYREEVVALAEQSGEGKDASAVFAEGKRGAMTC